MNETKEPKTTQELEFEVEQLKKELARARFDIAISDNPNPSWRIKDMIQDRQVRREQTILACSSSSTLTNMIPLIKIFGFDTVNEMILEKNEEYFKDIDKREAELNEIRAKAEQDAVEQKKAANAQLIAGTDGGNDAK